MGTFFRSRWVDVPAAVTELAGAVLPAGFRAAGVAAGIKESGAPDLALIVSDRPTASAARFSRTGAPSAPVLLTRRRTELGEIRAVVVNSGNANAATGNRGLEDAAKMQGGAAIVCGVSERHVAVASTGVIGVPLPMNRVMSGLAAAGRGLSPDGGGAFAEAIRTTDAHPKQISLQVALSGGTVTLAVQAKGAGMISPRFATLLVFIQTDAELDADEADLLLSVCTKRSFDRISVDGQLSTSDTIILQANGASGVRVEPESGDERIFGEALDAVLRQIALAVIADGEGARRVGRVVVRGGDDEAVTRVAHAVADSPLVKTALYGGDPNWGRIIQAVGAALAAPAGAAAAPLAVDIAIEGVTVCAGGSFVVHDAAALAAAVQRSEVEYEITLGGAEAAETERYFSDLGHEYVTINADYTT
ncbi:bifunctional glutamate N-acetyltransferase/amino-acid acetyltransferase ArgJ [Conexibacter sp. DBS9H8]|uniref:bifunctional glutamate N-acetyltransferase/amino-acid acetyltransferase ArgJ n=1 Tax=Conexibacter sp. DBS9H8 TaxID=2937801 RepID=UPI00200E1E8E|nr:bifunctional glutamate N-acetyltransferase/amino-acid acetyltransferase ArgJ [Conexibacter sp. DBS9H8]